jgi:threonylcarbamoyladenosine tRNA methylthiotransferase MtaB
MISQITGVERIRLGSLEPTIITPEFIRELKACGDIFCPHFHLSLQSGSAPVLDRMNRKYSPGEYLCAVRLIRGAYPEAAITTDVIVGFPGETDEEFRESLEFCKYVGFSKIHVFKFSPRKGTPAASYSGQVSNAVKGSRSKAMIALSAELSQQYCRMFVGRDASILVEKVGRADDGGLICEGLTPSYIRVTATLCGIGGAAAMMPGGVCADTAGTMDAIAGLIGKAITVKVTASSEDSLTATCNGYCM